jgi:hypothetical protein
VAITCGSNCLTVTTGELSIRFNPVDYASTSAEVLAYDANLTGAATLDAKAWVFGLGDNKPYDGTTTATVSGFLPDTTGVAPPVTLGVVDNASFDTAAVDDVVMGVVSPVGEQGSVIAKVAALKATVELQKVEMQQRFDSVEENYKQISNLLMALPGTSQVMELEQIKNFVAQSKADTDSQMAAVMAAVSRKKKRIPIRDQMGEIVEVREVDDDEQGGVQPMQIGPPGPQAIN